MGLYQKSVIILISSLTLHIGNDSVSEIKVLCYAHTGCIGSQNRAPDSLSMCSSLYKGMPVNDNHFRGKSKYSITGL